MPKEPKPLGLRPYYIATIEPDGWLPIPDEVLATLGLKIDDEVELFITHGQIIVRKKGAGSGDIPNPLDPPEGSSDDSKGTKGST